jgi:hypothetical protein
MKRPAAVSGIVLALGVIILAPRVGAQSQDSREEGPTEIEKCQTIDKPGSYKLVRNITLTADSATCLPITASDVTIDLAGFTISGPRGLATAAIVATPPQGQVLQGIAVRNGSISGFGTGVDLQGGSIVEGLRVSGPCPCALGIGAAGIVKGNTVVEIQAPPGGGIPGSGLPPLGL